MEIPKITVCPNRNESMFQRYSLNSLKIAIGIDPEVFYRPFYLFYLHDCRVQFVTSSIRSGDLSLVLICLPNLKHTFKRRAIYSLGMEAYRGHFDL